MTDEYMTDDIVVDELQVLKQRADDMGIKYSPNIGVEKLRDKVNEKLKPKEEVAANPAMARRQEAIKEAKKLVRVRVMNMNPNKKDWKGEIFTVSNSVVGTIKRFIPYDVEWHCEEFILKQIKTRQMSRFYTVLNDKGMKVRKFRLVPEFSVDILEPLTKAELKALAEDQAKRGAIDA